MNTQLSKIIFEEYDKETESEFYGQPVLKVGVGASTSTSVYDNNYAVFKPASGKLTEVRFPSHLKSLGTNVFNSMNTPGTVITFNADAKQVELGGAAFYKCTGITELQLPNVSNLGIGTFHTNANLTTVTFGADSSLKMIPRYAFYKNTALTAFHVPASVTLIDEYAFYDNTALASVTFAEGSNLEELGGRAFNNSALVEFTMPDSVILVGAAVFNGNKMLKRVHLSKNLMSVLPGESIFYQCPNIEHVSISEGSQYFKTIDGVLFDIAETIVYYFPPAKEATSYKLPDTLVTIERGAFAYFQGESIELPESLETIGDNAFQNSKLKSIHIPKNVKTIGQRAFQSSTVETYLESVTFAEGSKLTSIGVYAFAYNSLLTEIDIPDNVATMGSWAFGGCKNLKEVVLPAALKKLDSYLFYGCTFLASATMQEGLETIGQYCFGNGNEALTEIVIPSTVTEIQDSAFNWCKVMKTVTFAEGSQLKTLGNGVFYRCFALESIAFPASLETLQTQNASIYAYGMNTRVVYNNMFFQCESLKQVDMSACTNLKMIPYGMFGGCSAVETVLLPPNLETIESGAFYAHNGLSGLTGLKSITIPASVTSIGAYAFADCTSLETVIFEEGSPITELGVVELLDGQGGWGTGIFAGTTSLKNITLPKNLTTIGIKCFDNSGIAEIDLPSSVTHVADYAFRNCTNLVDADLSANLVYLGNEAYSGCSSLEKADLNFGLEYLGNMAFAHCVSLKRAYIPATVTSIVGNPFTGCSGVEVFELDEDNVDFVVEDGVLYDKTMYTILYYPASLKAETFEFPATVHEIGDGAFAGAQLKTMTIPDRITVIPQYTFNSSALESVTLHKALTYVGDYAFQGCTKLNNVTLPNSVEYAGDYAFAGCAALSNFVFEEKTEEDDTYIVGAHFFDGCTAMTKAIFPNRMMLTDMSHDLADWTVYVEDGCIPAYMFANTGIVTAEVPAYIVDLMTPGVFYNCTNLESVTFASWEMSCEAVGWWYFYNCSKLKELTIPAGVGYPIYGYESYVGCSSLEKFTMYVNEWTWLDCYENEFAGCVNLKSIELLRVDEYAYDEADNVIGYAKTSPTYMLSSGGSIWADTLVKQVRIGNEYDGEHLAYMYGPCFRNSNIEVAVIDIHGSVTVETNEYYGEPGQGIFSGAKALRDVWFIGSMEGDVSFDPNTFVDLDHDINFYFTDLTRDELIELIGDDEWLKNADENAKFYFKGEIPAGKEPPADLLK